MTIIFKNAGTIDPRSITTFGVSSKENASAVGFFGTGLKYAIAILLREGCGITIYSGKRQLTFGTKRDKIRVDSFEFVTMNNRRQGFTTELGKTWELWQAFRELYCNCMDEGGTVREGEPGEVIHPEPGHTTIVVTGRDFAEVYRNRSDIILETEPLETGDSCDIHPGPSQFLFYRGVRAYRLPRASMFTYNIKRKIDLTEDRTIKYLFEAEGALRRTILESENAERVRQIITAPKGTMEQSLEFSGVVPSDAFLGEVRTLANAFSRELNPSALEACRPWLLEALPAEGEELDALEASRLKKAVDFSRAVGFEVDAYPIVMTEWLGEGVLGRAHDGRIYVSKRTFMMGTKMLAGTLIEEFLHLRHQLQDCDRTMQNFLMDTIVSLGERITGEPL